MATDKDKKLKLDGLTKTSNKNAPDFHNREWLEQNEPTQYFTAENISSKYETEREEKTQSGLIEIAGLTEKTDLVLNPLMLLLAKWWEVKPARAAIKTMIDNEAAELKKDPTDYLQNEIGAQIDTLENIQSAINRLRYGKTYFKPRESTSTKVQMKSIDIDGKLYKVPVKELEQGKIDFAKDREGLKNFLISVAIEDEVESI